MGCWFLQGILFPKIITECPFLNCSLFGTNNYIFSAVTRKVIRVTLRKNWNRKWKSIKRKLVGTIFYVHFDKLTMIKNLSNNNSYSSSSINKLICCKVQLIVYQSIYLNVTYYCLGSTIKIRFRYIFWYNGWENSSISIPELN